MISIDPPFDFQFDQRSVKYLCRHQVWESSEITRKNCPFGLHSIFKEYAALPQDYPLRVTMEHGLKFDDNPSHIAKSTPFQAILTPSEIRTPVIEQVPGKRALPVGFAFLYAKALFAKFGLETIPEKARKGTLVFPFKSTSRTTIHFDHTSYATELKSLPQKFHPVFVCLYWADVKDGLAQIYQDAGLSVVTAGHRFDPLFFHRFYDLCRRFRYSASNDIGTNLFLAVESDCRFFYLEGPNLRREIIKRKIDDREGDVFDLNRTESLRLFSEPVEETTPEQLAFVNSFLGKEHFVSPKHLRRLLLREQRLFEKRPWWHSEKRLLAPPDATDFTWIKLAPCRGWQYPETNLAYRWMRQKNDAWVDLSFPRRLQNREAILSCQIHRMACEHLKISVNNQNISNLRFCEDENGSRFVGTVPPEILSKPLAKGIARISFHAEKPIPPSELYLHNLKKRHFGAAVSRISLRPKSEGIDSPV